MQNISKRAEPKNSTTSREGASGDSRFVEVSGMYRVGELGGVAVDECAVVFGVIFSCSLVFGEVQSSQGGEFGLQSLVTKQGHTII